MLALLGSALLLGLAWFFSNWVDADPQPWPEALTPRAGSVAEADNLWATLMAIPAVDGSQRLTLGECNSADCGATWRADSVRWAAMRQAHAALGAACESGTQRLKFQLAEPLQANFKPEAELPRFQQITGCSVWLLTLALEASAAGNVDVATGKLAQSARLSVAAVEGSQSLIGHMIALVVIDRHLHALQQIAIQHPAAAASLQALPLPTAAQIAAAQRRWVAHEASYGRSMIATFQGRDACSMVSGLGNWSCRISAEVTLPNYMEQLFSNYWLQVLASIRDDAPLSALNALESRREAPSTGLFGSPFHWRGTMPHILFEVAESAYQDYFVRSANTVLAAQATQLWLQAKSQAPNARASWLSLQTKDTPLANRLTVEQKGDLQLQVLKTSRAFRTPTRWPAWPT